MKTLADITERFRFEDDSLVYVDAPLEGFIVDVEDGSRYAFRCLEIVHGAALHWVLLPVPDDKRSSVSEIFDEAKIAPPQSWLSVLEDRRTDTPKLTLVRISTEKARPPVDEI